MHQDFVFDALAGIGAEFAGFLIVEGGGRLDQADGADGDQVLLLPGDGVIFLGRVKQKEEFSRSKTTP